jgi:FAD synthetase
MLDPAPPVKVMATGVFDILHPGHLYFLEEARKLGDALTVVVAHDDTVLRTKGKVVFAAADRLQLISALRMVDAAYIGDAHDRYKIVKALRPDIIALGHDQKFDEAALQNDLRALGVPVRVVRLPRQDGALVASRDVVARIRSLTSPMNEGSQV